MHVDQELYCTFIVIFGTYLYEVTMKKSPLIGTIWETLQIVNIITQYFKMRRKIQMEYSNSEVDYKFNCEIRKTTVNKTHVQHRQLDMNPTKTWGWSQMVRKRKLIVHTFLQRRVARVSTNSIINLIRWCQNRRQEDVIWLQH